MFTMTRLQLSLIGRFQAKLDSQPLSRFEYDKVRALLAYLAIESDFPHRRDALTGLFWPEQTDIVARKSLNQAVYTLRKVLGDKKAAQVPFILADHTTMQLNPDADVWVDVDAFQSGVTAVAHHKPIAVSETAVIDQIKAAIALYRGDFLKGMSISDSPAFDDWLALTREQLHRMAMETLETLIQYHTWRGEYSTALTYARRLVELAPWQEESQQVLIRLLAYCGRRSEALRQFDICQQTLLDELGLEPAPETLRLVERIRKNQDRKNHNLPILATKFVGREIELAEINSQLAHPDCRLLTIVGPGGIGKSRLALEVAAKKQPVFLDGVFLVSLSFLGDADSLVTAVANALGFKFADKGDPQAQLFDYLFGKELLLLLDNFENRLPDANFLTECLRQAPAVKLLLTSRIRLNHKWETVYELDGLSLPVSKQDDQIESFSAIRLFVQSAQRVQREFEFHSENRFDILHICQLVEGLPLAIELAASWVRAMQCREIASEIEQGIDFLATNAAGWLPRHRSIRVIFNHSWQTLSTQEQKVFCRLALFRSGFDREAATQVANASYRDLVSLIDKSLLRRESNGRYAMHELVRQYAYEKLTATKTNLTKTQQRHAIYYADLLRFSKVEIMSSLPQETIQILDMSLANIRDTWRWAVSNRRHDLIQKMCNGLFWFYEWRNEYAEGKELFEFAVNQLTAAQHPHIPLLTGLLVRSGYFYTRLTEYDKARAAFVESVRNLRQIGDQSELALATDFWGDLERQCSDYDKAKPLLNESISLYRMLDDSFGLACALNHLAAVVQLQGDYLLSKRYANESLACFRQIGSQWGIAISLHNLGYAAYELGEYILAEQFYNESLTLRSQAGDLWGISSAHNNLGIVFYDKGDYDRAEVHFQQSISIREALGDIRGMAITYNNLGLIADVRGKYNQAEQQYKYSYHLCRQIGYQQGVSIALNNLGEVSAAQGSFEQAFEYHHESLTLAREIGYVRSITFALEYLGEIALKLSRLEEAKQYYREALLLAWEAQAITRILQSLYGVAMIFFQKGDLPTTVSILQIVTNHSATAESTRSEAKTFLTEKFNGATTEVLFDEKLLERTVNSILKELD